MDAYLFGEKLHLLVGKDSDIESKEMFKGSVMKEIPPSMDDVFAYLVKKESGRDLDGGRISGTGRSSLALPAMP